MKSHLLIFLRIMRKETMSRPGQANSMTWKLGLWASERGWILFLNHEMPSTISCSRLPPRLVLFCFVVWAFIDSFIVVLMFLVCHWLLIVQEVHFHKYRPIIIFLFFFYAAAFFGRLIPPPDSYTNNKPVDGWSRGSNKHRIKENYSVHESIEWASDRVGERWWTNDDYGNSKSNRTQLKCLLIIIKISFPDHVLPSHNNMAKSWSCWSYLYTFPLPVVKVVRETRPFRFV